MTLDERLKQIGLSDAEIARQVGCSRPYITKIRHRTRTPSLRVAAKLEDVTGIPATEFIGNAV